MKGLIFGGAAIVLILLVLFLLPTSSKNQELNRLKAKDWTHASYNDPDFADCMSVEPCLARKAQSETLKAVQDWQKVKFDGLILQDCMEFKPCEDRKTIAAQLQSTTEWRQASAALLSNCMGYDPCIRESAARAGRLSSAKEPSANVSLSEDDLPACCEDASNKAQCKAAKKRLGVDDCTSPMGHQ